MLAVGYRFWTVVALVVLLLAACGGQGVDGELSPTPVETPARPSPSATPRALESPPAAGFASPLTTPPSASPSAPLVRPTAVHTPCPWPKPRPRATAPTAYGRLPLGRARSQEEIVALARQYLAERLGVPLERVEVVGVEEVLWDEPPGRWLPPPAKAPDRAYPGPLPGYRIVLSVDGVEYEFHSWGPWLIFWGQAE